MLCNDPLVWVSFISIINLTNFSHLNSVTSLFTSVFTRHLDTLYVIHSNAALAPCQSEEIFKFKYKQSSERRSNPYPLRIYSDSSVAELNVALCLVNRAKKLKYEMFHSLERESNPGTARNDVDYVNIIQ